MWSFHLTVRRIWLRSTCVLQLMKTKLAWNSSDFKQTNKKSPWKFFASSHRNITTHFRISEQLILQPATGHLRNLNSSIRSKPGVVGRALILLRPHRRQLTASLAEMRSCVKGKTHSQASINLTAEIDGAVYVHLLLRLQPLNQRSGTADSLWVRASSFVVWYLFQA